MTGRAIDSRVAPRCRRCGRKLLYPEARTIVPQREEVRRLDAPTEFECRVNHGCKRPA